MKRNVIIALLFFFAIGFAGAQDGTLSVNGHVIDIDTGMPIPDQMVAVTVTGGGMYLTYEFFTNDAGFYGSDSIPAPSQGQIRAVTYDCIGEEHNQEEYFNPGNMTFTFDFIICGDSILPGDCENFFWYDTWDNLTFDFYGESFPMPADSYFWDFGDNTTGGGQIVTHTFDPSLGDVFNVTLTTFSYDPATGDSCVATSMQEVWVGNGGGGDCVADFTYTIDSVPGGAYVVQFTDASIGNPQFWMWEFGDGEMSEEQNPEHIYYESGEYMVCLTIFSDSTSNCFDSYCEMIIIGNGGGGNDCENWFWYDTWDNLTFEFYGESSPFPADYYSWDFGDGTTGYGQMVDHTYDPAMGDVFLVTLTTMAVTPGTVDTCVAVSQQEVWLNNGGVDCENWFWYESSNDFTYDFFGESFPYPADYYSWDFGDGTSGVGQFVTHTFDPSTGNNFTVCLTTLSYNPGNDSCFATSCQEIILGGQAGVEIMGTVYMDNTPADFALVGLFGMEAGGSFIYEFVTTIPGTGSYFFENVPQGDYLIVASLTPQSPYFIDYFPTYYGDALFWFDATEINLGDPNNPYDINLIPITSMNQGPGLIEGTITFGDEKGGPAENIIVVLMDEDEQALTYIHSNADGQFDFSDLAFGTYKLKLEIPGITSAIATVVISEENQSGNISFVVEDNYVYLSVDDNEMEFADAGNIFPNPATGQVNINIIVEQPMNLNITILNQLGQFVYQSDARVQNGNNKLEINTSDLTNGLYNMIIRDDQGNQLVRKFMKK